MEVTKDNKGQVRAMIVKARELVAAAQKLDKHVVFDTYPIEQAEKALAACEDDGQDKKDKKAAAHFDKLMSRIKEKGKITRDYVKKVREARKAYDALNENAKKMVHPANPGKLMRVEARIEKYMPK